MQESHKLPKHLPERGSVSLLQCLWVKRKRKFTTCVLILCVEFAIDLSYSTIVNVYEFNVLCAGGLIFKTLKCSCIAERIP